MASTMQKNIQKQLMLRKAVMDLNLYSLHSDYSGLFKSNNSVESIFTVVIVSGSRHVCIEIAWGPNGYGGWEASHSFSRIMLMHMK